jgi:hypothetical protein
MTDTMTDMLTDEKQLEFRLDGKSIIPYKWELKIRQDKYPDNPRKDYCNDGLFWVPERCNYVDNEFLGGSCDEPSEELTEKVRADYWIFPVSVLDHSGQTIWVGLPTDPWDSFQIGWYLVPKTRTLHTGECDEVEYITKESARELAKNEVNILDACWTGSVYEYTLYRDGEEWDSLCGLYMTRDMSRKEFAEYIQSQFGSECNLTEDDILKAMDECEY